MPRQATIRYVSLRSSLVNLPLSLYGPLVEHRARPQGVAIHLSATVNGKLGSAHVGWTGLASASSLAQWQNRLSSAASSSRDASFETIEIDPQFASSLGFPENTIVDIGLLHDLPVATRVATEPRTADDWEIMELHANYMEESMLSQVRVAVVGQEIDAWVLGRTRVRFLVVSTEPSGGPCLLSTDTEVSIAPKSRAPSKQLPNGTGEERPKPIVNSSSHSADKRQTRTPVTLRILPRVKDYTPAAVSVATLMVSPHTFAVISSDSGSTSNVYVRVNVLRPPFTILDKRPDTPKADETRVFKPQEPSGGDASKTSQKGVNNFDEEAKPLVARALADPTVPQGHAIAFGVPSISSWDLVAVTAALPADGEPPRIVYQPEPATLPPKALAGVSKLVDTATDYILHGFVAQAQAAQSPGETYRGSQGAQGLLLVGRPGSGRTSVAQAVAQRLRDDPRVYAQILYKDMVTLAEDRVAVVKSEWTALLERAAWSRPSIVILDNLDVLVGAELEHADSSRQRQLAEQFLAGFSSGRDLAGVAVIAIAKGAANLHPLLSTSHIFGLHLTLMPPNRDARRDIMSELVREHIAQSDLQLDMEDAINYVALATTTEGYSATDLKDLVAGAVHHAAMRERPALGSRDFERAQKEFVPLSLRDVQQTKRTEVRWAVIGGLGETRRVLRETLEWPTKYGAIFAESPLRLRSGLLLYGYPGCGKTLLASAVARECGLNFIGVKGPELLNKYIGASEKSVRDLFERATAAKPCILFFDEFDSIAPKRGHDSTGVTDRVVNQMLTQMDGAEGLDGVYVLAATSRPDLIDPALLRPGRLDKALLCNMPDLTERQEILSVVARKLTLSPDVEISDYAAQTEGYSGADLQALLYNAHLDAVHESITVPLSDSTNGARPGEDNDRVHVTTFGGPTEARATSRLASAAESKALERRMAAMLGHNAPGNGKKPSVAQPKPKIEIHDGHLMKALRGMKPSLPVDERLRLDFIYDKFRADRSGDLPRPGASNGVGQRASLM